MKAIKTMVKKEIIIKNSKFIAILDNVNNEDDAKNLLTSIKKDYKKATHYCYAYIINDIKRFDDDGEPNGTAGVPILNVLEKNELKNIICIVVRYFGGIKLGAGGLVRAYGKAVREALSESIITNIMNGFIINLSFTYENLKNIDSLIGKRTIVNKIFEETITYTILIEEQDLNIIDQLKLNGATILDIKKDYIG